MSSETPIAGPRRSERIGKYEVLAHIATGGMGAVYRARDTESGAEVALKVLMPELARKPAMLERFRREARNAQELRHENIVAVYGAEHVKSGGQTTWFMVMEYVEGIDLHEHIETKGRLDLEESRQIMIQAARALNHAHRNDIVHRDIKPSNFLLGRKRGKLIVKLTDLGLSRLVHKDEFRVTRSGTTVGTVDYIAPEQARDSGAADIRSDLYSLGCTWFHMLAGQPPFAEGGLAERLVKHMNDTAPDIRDHNDEVSDDLAEVMNKLLAKKPSQRYQTPQELLTDLQQLRADKPASSQDTVPDVRPSPSSPSMNPKTPRRTSAPPKKAAARVAGQSRVVILVMSLALVVMGGVAVAFSLRTHEHPAATAPDLDMGKKTERPRKDPPRQDPPKKRPDVVAETDPNPGDHWKKIYPGTPPFDPTVLREEFLKPWSGPEAREDIVLRVARAADRPGERVYPTLAAAVAAAPRDALAAIEIHDNGPLFETGLSVADRRLIIRAGPGYRPLLVWDVERTAEERKKDPPRPAEARGLAFLEVRHGDLTVQGCEIVTRWPATGPRERAAVAVVRDGDLTLRRCSVSVTGGPADGIAAALVTSAGPRSARCRLDQCYLRGLRLLALDVDAASAEVLLDQILLVGGDQPALSVRAGSEPERSVTVRTTRCTLLTARTLLWLGRPAAGPSAAVSWTCHDTLLSRAGETNLGSLVDVEPGVDLGRVRFEPLNCVYAGWANLLTGGGASVTALDGWRQRWGHKEGDAQAASPWPGRVAEPETMAAAEFRVTDKPIDRAVAYGATLTPGQPVGCDPAAPPPTRERWSDLTYDRVLTRRPDVPGDDAPEIPDPGDGRYHGERIDLTRRTSFDLGAHLQDIVKQQRPLGPRVVLRLAGADKVALSSPLRWHGNLVLYFEPPAKDAAKPDAAAPLLRYLPPSGGAPPDAWLTVENGDLDIINGDLQARPATGAKPPAFLLRVKGGALRLTKTRLRGPDTAVPGFRGLVAFEGDGSVDPDQGRPLVVNDSVLLSGLDGIYIRGIGVRLLIRGSLLATGGDALRLDLGEGYRGTANAQVLLEHSTVAVRSAVLRMDEPACVDTPADPVVVQSGDCVFLAPFEAPARAGLLLGQGDAVQRGLVVWQGKNDLADNRLHYVCASDGAVEGKAPSDAWKRFGGGPGGRDGMKILNLGGPAALPADNWSGERLSLLALPYWLPDPERRAGADLVKLHVVKKR